MSALRSAAELAANADRVPAAPYSVRCTRTFGLGLHENRERQVCEAVNDSQAAAYLRCLEDVKQCVERESQVVRLVLQGLSDAQIANDLAIDESIVKRHLQHAYTKLGIYRRDLVVAARKSS
jgi:ATP/maltotriose-dependent transcriptional regulator MalT